MKEGWEYKKLKEVGLTQTGTTPSKQIKSFYGGDIPFIRPAELNIDQNGGILYESELKLTEEGALKARVIKENSVLMCCIGSVGKTGFTLRSVTCNQQINTITPYDNYNPKFVYYALISPSFQQEVTKIANSAKATLPIISKGKWEVLSIPIPPLSEQQSIVNYLDSAFAKIDAMKANAEKSLNEAKALFQASLKEMLEPKEGWEEKKVGDISEIKGGKRLPKGEKLQSEPTSHKYIRVADFNEYGTVNLDDILYISDNVYEHIKRYIIKKEDIYISIAGTIGKSGIIPEELDGANLTENACRLILSKEINQRFMYYITISPEFIRQEIESTKISAQPKLALTRLSDIIITFPPLSEQQSIVATLDSLKSKVDRLQANFEKISQECDALKQALLREVFEG